MHAARSATSKVAYDPRVVAVSNVQFPTPKLLAMMPELAISILSTATIAKLSPAIVSKKPRRQFSIHDGAT